MTEGNGGVSVTVVVLIDKSMRIKMFHDNSIKGDRRIGSMGYMFILTCQCHKLK